MRFLPIKQLSAAVRSSYAASPLTPYSRRNLSTCTTWVKSQPSVLASPWSTTQLRHARFAGADVRVGNVIERKGKMYQVLKAQHTSQGRGGAIIQVELRDVDSGNKLNERLRTDETVEKVFVQEKQLTYLYTDDESGNIVLMDPETYSQLDVPRHLFGESLVYLQDDMKVSVQLFDERAMSASIPSKVTCTVAEAAEAVKQSSKSTPNKKVLLDNGVSVQVPAHVLTGDKIIVNTTNNSYISKA